MKLRLAVAAIAATVFLTASPRASAELLTLQLNRTVTGTVTVNLGSKTDNVTPGPYYWSDINDPPNTNFPAPIATFCMELLDPNGQPAGSPTVGASFTFEVLPLTSPYTSLKGDAARADAIKALFGNYYNPAWAGNTFTGDTESKAFQLALWELIYETDPTKTLSSGYFNSPSSAATRANQMLAGLSGGLAIYNAASYEVVALVAPTLDPLKQTPGQDQIVVRPKSVPAVPAPPALLLAGIGVVALVGRSRLSRKATA
ncbi:MAG: hypothetical protein ACKODX_22435 [Gemmata sp.]